MSEEDLKENQVEVVVEGVEGGATPAKVSDKARRKVAISILLGFFAFVFILSGIGTLLVGSEEDRVRAFDPEAIENEVMASGEEVQFENGDFYKGEVNDNWEPHGNGHYARMEDSSVYIGGFENGKRSGLGWMSSPEGEFRGIFVDGQPNGFGIIQFNDFTGYEGGFKDGAFHGEGQLMFMNGPVEAGRWENGVKVADLPIKDNSGSGGILGFIGNTAEMVRIVMGIALGIFIFVTMNKIFRIWYWGIGGVISFFVGCIFAGALIVNFFFGF